MSSRAARLARRRAAADLPWHHDMVSLLALLRALQWNYQHAHWQTVGPEFYGNHLMFERLYNTLTEEIDTLAEKVVGHSGYDSIDLLQQMVAAHWWLQQWASISCHHKRSMWAEMMLQSRIAQAMDLGLPAGLEDFLQGVANAHDTHIYLLRQTLDRPPRTAAVLRTVWLVSNPGPESLLEDICSEVTAVALAKLARGSDMVDINYGDWTLHDDRSSAVADAIGRLEKVREKPVRGWGQPSRILRATDSGAGSEAARFFDNPEKREVREFAQAGAVSNDPAVAAGAAGEAGNMGSVRSEAAAAGAAPPTPDEVVDLPGGEVVSTLNRLMVDTAEKAPGTPESRDELLEKTLQASWPGLLG